MKVTTEQVLKLLSDLGLSDVQLVESEPDEINTEEQAVQLAQRIIDNHKPQLKTELEGEINAALVGKQMGTFRSAIRERFGLTISELKDLEVKEMLEKAYKKALENSSKDTEELRAEIERIVGESNATIEQLKDAHKKELDAERSKATEALIDDALSLIIDEIPRVGGNKTAQLAALKNELNSKYHLHYDAEKKTIELRNKDNTEMKVMDGLKIVSPKDVSVKHFEDMGLLVTDTSKVNPNNVNAGNARTGLSTKIDNESKSTGDPHLDWLNQE